MQTLNLKGNLYTIDGPNIMGIINVTPDSFYDGGTTNNTEKALHQAEKMLQEGAHWLDIGGYSSRPNATDVTQEEELKRVLPVIEAIKKEFPQSHLSIDTFRSNVAKEAVEAGAEMVNDISGGALDPKMYETVAQLKVPYILMHMRGTPQDMQSHTDYDDIFLEMITYFNQKVAILEPLGVDVIIDMGFGFSKTLDQNYNLLKNLPYFDILKKPILVGVSRKSMIYKLLDTSPSKALNGTTVLHTLALRAGANFLRVHDVKEAMEVVKITQHMTSII